MFFSSKKIESEGTGHYGEVNVTDSSRNIVSGDIVLPHLQIFIDFKENL